MGSLEVRLATTRKEIRQAQRLRFKVFYEERSAVPNGASLFSRRDKDDVDWICDHLVVLDHDVQRRRFHTSPEVVGTYRLLRQDVADQNWGFSTAAEYNIEPLLAAHPHFRFLELGRSCVSEPFRNKRTLELLWHGIWAYVHHFDVDVMLGCASFPGTDPRRLALPLSYLHYHAGAAAPWCARALEHRYTAMNILAPEALDSKAAVHALPPLIKGYLRAGAAFGDGAVVDQQFGTTDVLVVLPVSAINRRYINHFGSTAERYAGCRPDGPRNLPAAQ